MAIRSGVTRMADWTGLTRIALDSFRDDRDSDGFQPEDGCDSDVFGVGPDLDGFRDGLVSDNYRDGRDSYGCWDGPDPDGFRDG